MLAVAERRKEDKPKLEQDRIVQKLVEHQKRKAKFKMNKKKRKKGGR